MLGAALLAPAHDRHRCTRRRPFLPSAPAAGPRHPGLYVRGWGVFFCRPPRISGQAAEAEKDGSHRGQQPCWHRKKGRRQAGTQSRGQGRRVGKLGHPRNRPCGVQPVRLSFGRATLLPAAAATPPTLTRATFSPTYAHARAAAAAYEVHLHSPWTPGAAASRHSMACAPITPIDLG